MTTVLLSGSPERVAEVAAALRERGADAVEVGDLDQLVSAVAGRQLDAYVQLPVRTPPRDHSVITRVRDFLATGLLRRFDAVEVVLPALSAEGSLLLVAGHHPESASTPDDRQARQALLRVLASAVRADRGPGLRVSVLDHDVTPEQVAERALGGSDAGQPGRIGLPPTEPTDRYEDWRVEIIGLSYVES